jgi:hypothetical protein
MELNSTHPMNRLFKRMIDLRFFSFRKNVDYTFFPIMMLSDNFDLALLNEFSN